ncbi:hypothetical protein B0H19DRAFT_471445 [Mycena capillaripes]|nr:hypothetical protein B0H19DRAFT_471445 [Mycena capillaripes]
MVHIASQFLALLLVAGGAQYVSATPAKLTVTVLPALNPQSTAAPAVVLGVDSQGRTTYAVELDEIQGGSTAPLTATLVEGSDHVGFTLSHTAASETIIIGYDCGLKNGKAICSGVDSNSQPGTATASSLGEFVLDVVSTAAPSEPTSESAAPSSPSDKPSSSRRASASISSVLGGLVLAAYWLI